MTIHLVLLYGVFCLSFFYRQWRDKLKNKSHIPQRLLFVIFTILVLFIGLRSIRIGTDTVTYVTLFRLEDFSYSNVEFIPQLIARVIRMFTDKYCIYLIVMASICLFGVYYNAKRYDFDTEYFIFLYMTSFCYLYATSAIRFFCAFSIIMISLKYMAENKTRKVILLVILASMFHTGALIFLPVYFIVKGKFSTNRLILIVISMILFIIILKAVNLNVFFENDLLSKYEYVVVNQNAIGGLSVFMNIGILVFALAYLKSIKEYRKEYEFFIKVHVVGMMLDFVGIAYRIIWYFRFPIFFILPIVLRNLKKERKRDYMIIYVSFVVIYSLLYYYYIKVSLPSHNLLNYEFNTLFD